MALLLELGPDVARLVEIARGHPEPPRAEAPPTERGFRLDARIPSGGEEECWLTHRLRSGHDVFVRRRYGNPSPARARALLR